MKKSKLIQRLVPRSLSFSYKNVLKTYADLRVGATDSETYNDGDSIVLTFDDYGTAEQVERLLGILDRERVRAVFFVQGNWAAKHPELVKQLAAAGHLIGNHTHSHPDLLGLSDEDIRREIAQGVPSQWLRPPRGRYNARVRQIAAGMGLSIKYWSIDSDDWQGVTAEYMADKILGQLRPRAVILFHLHAAHTPEVLPGLIGEIRRRGYKLAAPGEAIWGQS